MPVMSKINEISDGYWLRQYATKNGIPADCIRPYQILFNQGVGHFKNLIDDVIRSQGSSISVPMKPTYLEDYFSGYTFEYRTFCNLYEIGNQTEGFWMPSEDDPRHVIVHYNRCTSPTRIRYNQMHELMHFAQSVDPRFLNFLDELILNTTL